MNGRQVLWLVLIGGVAIWLWKSGTVTKEIDRATSPAPQAETGHVPGAGGQPCVSAAEDASRQTHEAAMVLLRTPVDATAYSTASGHASAAIALAEGRCTGGGASANDQKAMEEARAALSEMRALLSDLSGALSGSGSAADTPRRRETIDARLDAARAALRG